MSKKGGDTPAPAAPDPYAVASAQTGSNVQTATANTYLNNADEYGPGGTVKYVQTGWSHIPGTGDPFPDSEAGRAAAAGLPWKGLPGDPGNQGGGPDWGGGGQNFIPGQVVPKFERHVQLSDGQQRIFDAQTETEARVSEAARDLIPRLNSILSSDVAKAPGFQSLGTMLPNLRSNIALQRLGDLDFTANRNRVQDALMQRLNPSLTAGRDALEAKLVNQGLVRGTEAFNGAADEFGRQENDARLAVIAQAGQEEDRSFNQALQTATFNNGAELDEANFANQAAGNLWNARSQATQYDNGMGQQAWENDLRARRAPVDEIGALLGLGSVQMPNAPAYQGGTVAATPVGDYVYRSAQLKQDAWKTEQQTAAASSGAMAGLGSSLLGGLFKLSDRRLKTGIRAIGVTLPSGLPLYAYRIGGRAEVGVMADEAEVLRPEAVVTLASGVQAVDYARVVH